jgi:putative SOS response-associated peptidase YedK
MCGRFSLTANNDELHQRFGFSVLQNLVPRWNIAPSQSSLVLRQRGLELGAEMAEFGKPAGPQHKRLINARSETVTQKPTFKEAFIYRRCLVVASGWFEWSAPRQPWHIQLRDGRVMAMAGLYFDAPKGQSAQFVILTTDADGSLQDVHHRCPLVLPASHWSVWLSGNAEQAKNCLVPPSSRFFNAYRVHPDVGNIKNDNAALVAPYSGTEQASQPQADLFG